MKVAMVGAGAIARAYAVLATRAGHTAALWSPGGSGANDLAASATAVDWPGARASTLAASGVVEGPFTVAALRKVIDEALSVKMP